MKVEICNSITMQDFVPVLTMLNDTEGAGVEKIILTVLKTTC